MIVQVLAVSGKETSFCSNYNHHCLQLAVRNPGERGGCLVAQQNGSDAGAAEAPLVLARAGPNRVAAVRSVNGATVEVHPSSTPRRCRIVLLFMPWVFVGKSQIYL